MSLCALLLAAPACKKGDDKPNNENPPAQRTCEVSRYILDDNEWNVDLFDGDIKKIIKETSFKAGVKRELTYSYLPDGRVNIVEGYEDGTLKMRQTYNYARAGTVIIQTAEEEGGKMQRTYDNEFTIENGQIVFYVNVGYDDAGNIKSLNRTKLEYTPEGNLSRILNLDKNGVPTDQGIQLAFDDKPNPFYNRLDLFARMQTMVVFLFSKNNMVSQQAGSTKLEIYNTYYPEGNIRSIADKTDTAKHLLDLYYRCK